MRTFAAGTLLTLTGCAAYLVYYALSWDHANRSALVVLSTTTLIASLALPFVPVEKLVQSHRWREPFFLSWSASLIAAVSIGAALDGGAHSPLALAFFLPIAFASLSYPTRTMSAVIVLDIASFLTVAVTVGNVSAAFDFMFASALATAGWMAVWQARNHEWHLAERRRGEQRIADLAYKDARTGLPNRARVEEALAEAVAADEPVALLDIDLDGFKVVNDSLGHAAGDQILCMVASRLEEATAGCGLLARHGGDEFAVVTTQLGDDPERSATELAERLLASLREPLSVDGVEFELGAGIGIAIFPDHAKDPDDLLGRAQAAMHHAKASGHSRVTVYEHEGDDPQDRLQLMRRLRRALAEGRLIVHYQPIVDPVNGEVVAVEALARWDDPELGLIPPQEFIPFAERTGMIAEIGDRVVDLICAQARRWRDAALTPAITFNVSPRELRAPDYAARLRDRITAAGLDPAGFTAEITESAMVDDPARVEPVLHELAATGIRLAIDDFGAEHSSLGRLHTLPVDMIKLDRSLLRAVPVDQRAAAIVGSLLTLAKALDVISVVEGVETEEQRTFLLSQDCQLAQGYGLGRPATPEATTHMLEQDVVAREIRADQPLRTRASS
jgi:diguanylate cyclase (GGDEF)-like protein